MNIDKSVFGVLSILVAVIVVATVAIPIVEDSSKDIRTSSNNTTQRYMAADNTDVEIALNDDKSAYLINGYSAPLEYGIIYYVSDDIICFYGKASTTSPSLSILTSSAFYTIDKVVVSGGTCTGYDSAGEVAMTIPSTGTQYAISESGTYGFFTPTTSTPLIVNKDSIIFGLVTKNLTSTSESSIAFRGFYKGTIDNLTLVAASDTATIDTANVTSSQLLYTDLGNDSYQITNRSLTITATVSGEEYTGAGPLTIFAPIEYKIITQNDSAMISLLQIVPLLLLIVPVMMAIRMYSSRGE